MPTLIAGAISIHTVGLISNHPVYTEENVDRYGSVIEKVSILAPVRGFNINFNYDPQRAYTDQQGVRHVEPNFTYIPSATKLIGPIVNILILLPLGMYLYTRSPNEQNGNFLLYPKLKTLCMICCVTFIGMFGGMAAGGSHSIVNYYIGFIGTSTIVYLLLSCLLKFKFSWRVK